MVPKGEFGHQGAREGISHLLWQIISVKSMIGLFFFQISLPFLSEISPVTLSHLVSSCLVSSCLVITIYHTRIYKWGEKLSSEDRLGFLFFLFGRLSITLSGHSLSSRHFHLLLYQRLFFLSFFLPEFRDGFSVLNFTFSLSYFFRSDSFFSPDIPGFSVLMPMIQ